jgi:hypothetical protein
MGDGPIEPRTGPWRRYIVAGDRNWHCAEIADRVVRSLLARHDNTITIVHGAAPGVDSSFAEACERLGVAREPHPAEWGAYGDAAGPRRNQAMVDAGALYAIAVHRYLPKSRGTKDMVRRCLKAGIEVYLIDGTNPTRRVVEPP